MGVRRGPRNEAGPGSGPRLDPDTAGYFRRALETLQEGLSPEELGEGDGGVSLRRLGGMVRGFGGSLRGGWGLRADLGVF